VYVPSVGRADWTQDTSTALGPQTTQWSTTARVASVPSRPAHAPVSGSVNITDGPTRGWSGAGRNATAPGHASKASEQVFADQYSVTEFSRLNPIGVKNSIYLPLIPPFPHTETTGCVVKTLFISRSLFIDDVRYDAYRQWRRRKFFSGGAKPLPFSLPLSPSFHFPSFEAGPLKSSRV